MTTIEGFRPPQAERSQIEKGKSRREGFFKKLGALVRRELGMSSPEAHRASDKLRANLRQTRDASPHRVAAEAFRTPTPAEKVDLGHSNHEPTLDPRFRQESPLPTEQGQPGIVEGEVTGVEYSIPFQRAHTEELTEGTLVRQGRERYGRHDSGETKEPTATGTHKTIKPIQGGLDDYVPYSYNESEIIGSDAWHTAQEEVPSSAHEVSLGTESWYKEQEEKPVINPHEASIGEPVKWLEGDAAKAIVQEQQYRMQEQAARAKAEDHSGDESWQARQVRRERLLRMQGSVRPGEYKPHVISEQPKSENHDQKAA